MQTFLRLLLFICFFLVFVNKQVFASDVVFFDSFSSSLEKWEVVRGTTNSYSIFNGKLHFFIQSPFSTTEIQPKQEIWKPEWKNYILTMEVTPIKGTDKNVVFSFFDSHNWTEIHFFFNEFEVGHIENDVMNWSKRGSANLINGFPYELKIVKLNNKIQIFLDSVQIFESVFPIGYISNKFSIKATTGSIFPTEILFDNIRVELLDTTPPFPVFKQTDPAWSSLEYDTASRWSPGNSGIGAYGCALTSTAMILHAHGIATLPSGESITPATLNSWLQSQPDGYIGDGLMNFAAISRLTAVMSASNNTPKLEYTRTSVDHVERARAELSQNIPVILQIPGHFLVGYAATDTDISIVDPAYAYSFFSEHAQPLLSTRLLTPSHTDLSYIVVAAPSSIETTLLDSQGTPVAQSHTEQGLAAYPSSQSHTYFSVLEYAKPAAGSYTLLLESDGTLNQTTAVAVYTYSEDGTVQVFHPELSTQSPQNRYTVTFQKSGSSQVVRNSSWQEFAATVTAFRADRAISRFYISEALLQLTANAETLNTELQHQLLEQKEALLTWFAWGVSDSAEEALRAILSSLLTTAQQ